jgi:hypothetical protein
MVRFVSAAPYMVFHFYYGACGVEAATKKFCAQGCVGRGFASDSRRHVEKHVFDVARLVQILQALGEAFDMVF